MFQLKLKRVTDAAKARGDIADFDELTNAADFKDIKDFILIGGNRDPLDVTYTAPVKDISGREFKTGERYLWFKMAEHFGDIDSAKLLLTTDDTTKAQEIVDKVKVILIIGNAFVCYYHLRSGNNVKHLKCMNYEIAPVTNMHRKSVSTKRV